MASAQDSQASKYDQRAIEKEVYDFWQAEKIPTLISQQRVGKKKFFLLDGPPYANNAPHVGHVKTTTCKDIWSRYKLMQGFESLFLPGFDCHGLPTEVMVEKELGIKSKAEIEQIGVQKFDEMCLTKVSNTEKVWVEYYKALGAWRGDYEPYFTYKDYYIQSGWWTAKQLYEKGLMVEGHRAIHWCSHCETSLSGYEVSDSYKEMVDPSVFVKFPVVGKQKEYLLVWTTTPWTLPSNVAVAVKGDATYVKVEYKGENYILAKARLEAIFSEMLKAKPSEYKVVEEFSGESLAGLRYVPLLDVPQQKSPDMMENGHKVILSVKVMMNKKYKKHVAKEEGGQSAAASVPVISKPAEAVEEYEDFVTMAEGTGLVHCAPGAGQSDNYVGKHYGLPALSPIDVRGCFTEEAGEWKGKFVKKADPEIIEHLKAKGLMLFNETITHRTTLCWRCKTPLIFRLSRQWYLKVDPIKEKMMSENESVNWLPPFGQAKMANWIADREDWCVSQQRYWGIPIPIWECASCGRKKFIGSKKELVDNAVNPPKDLSDLHRHTVDPIKLKCECGKEMERIKDIFNVWFDSGIAPWASLGYPFQNKELFESVFPVDLIVESQDQVRGWFDSLLFASVGTFGHKPYKSVGLMGWVLDEKGEKMSKSVGNVVPAKEAIEKVGADVIRFYYCWEVAPWDVQKFSFKSASEIQRFLSIFYNTYTFFETYLPQGFAPHAMDAAYWKTLPAEDRYIVSAVNRLSGSVAGHMELFEFHLAGRELVSFVNDSFSRWYVKLVRDRVSGDNAKSREQALSTMHYVLMTCAKLMAPMTPFISEKVYQKLSRFEKKQEKSVHFCAYPNVNSELVDADLITAMQQTMSAIEAINGLRVENKIKLRWPVSIVRIKAPVDTEASLKPLKELISRAANANDVEFVGSRSTWDADWAHCSTVKTGANSGFEVGIKIARDSDMMNQAGMREVSRAVQAARKAAGLVVTDRISLSVHCESKQLEKYLAAHEKELASEVGAAGNVDFSMPKAVKDSLDLAELGLGKVSIGLKKA